MAIASFFFRDVFAKHASIVVTKIGGASKLLVICVNRWNKITHKLRLIFQRSLHTLFNLELDDIDVLVFAFWIS